MNIAIIPARGGSKRIPRKNIKEFHGRPIISYAIDVAKKSNLFERICVSTDDEEIAQIARDYGAETPFLRPLDLANDYVATVPVIAHAINSLGLHFGNVCCIYPCAPFIQIVDLENTLRLIVNNPGEYYSFPVAEFPSAIERALALDEGQNVRPFYPENERLRSQDLKKSYYDAGQFYWGTVSTWLSNLKIHSSGLAIPIPFLRAIDIDTLEDWQFAESIYSTILKNDMGGLG